MSWALFDAHTEQCSCGITGCPILIEVGEAIRLKEHAQPLLTVWQIVDKYYWPNKKQRKDGLIRDSFAKIPGIDSNAFKIALAQSQGALEAIIDTYRHHTPKRAFVDNTKLFHIAEMLLSHSEDWKVIILLRDPRGIMYSYKKVGIRKGDNREASSILSLASDFMKSARKLDGMSRVCMVRYEDFCRTPEKVFEELQDFIGVAQIQPSSLDPEHNRGHILKGNRLLRRATIGPIIEDCEWKSGLTEDDLEKLYRDTSLLKLYEEQRYAF